MVRLEYLNLDWKRSLAGREGVDGSGQREEIPGEMLRFLEMGGEGSEV